MFKILLIFVAVLCCCNLVSAQNVFSPTDSIANYNKNAAAGTTNNPTQPPWFVMSKWVKGNKVTSWNTSNFKAYIWNGLAFRMRFPNNYNPANASKYPVIIFLHGGGEIGNVYDNDLPMTWGAQVFEQRINSGEWNGFLIFPQSPITEWNDDHFSRINSILDTLQKYNNSDPDETITMGLSMGAFGSIFYASLYPKRIATALAASPANISQLTDFTKLKHVPVWMADGGTDANPAPFNANVFYTNFRNAGANIYNTYYVNDGHNTWTDMWNQKNKAGAYIISTYWNSAHKAQPLLYFQNSQFCNTGPISARMGITAGFNAYEWQQDGATIGGANGNEYTATQAGQYRVRFQRNAGGAWSDWSPSPVVIATKTCAVDTLFAEHFTPTNTYGGASAYSYNNFICQNGIMTSGTDQFTQDASGIQGSRFLVNFTNKVTASCTYTSGDEVWNAANVVPVTTNTSYEFSFYMGNQGATSLAQLAPVINGVVLTPSYVQPTGVGNASWKKYTFTWNSGIATTADLSIINKSNATTGNDFAIDEISLVPTSTTTRGNSSLPLTWLSVTAKLTGKDVQVDWKISSEVNVSNYIVERSSDGRSFSSIGTVSASSFIAVEKQYGLTDRFAPEGISYYRIRQTDLDGQYTYSKTVAIRIPQTGEVMVWPNPAVSTVNVNAGQVIQRVQCFNSNGQLVYDVKPASVLQYAIPVQQWAPGMYLITITGSSRVTQSKFIKQ